MANPRPPPRSLGRPRRPKLRGGGRQVVARHFLSHPALFTDRDKLGGDWEKHFIPLKCYARRSRGRQRQGPFGSRAIGGDHLGQRADPGARRESADADHPAGRPAVHRRTAEPPGRTVPRGRARADSHLEHGGLRAHGPGGNGGAARWVDANQDRRNRVVNASEVILLEEGGPTFA